MSNKGKKWTIDDIDKLINYVKLGLSFEQIAKELGRTESAIYAKYESLDQNIEFNEEQILYLKQQIQEMLKYLKTDIKNLYYNINKIKFNIDKKTESDDINKDSSSPEKECIVKDETIIDPIDIKDIKDIKDNKDIKDKEPPLMDLKFKILKPPTVINENITPVINENIKPKKEELNEYQKGAFELFLKGKSMCITGPAGTGKSYLINIIKKHCIENNINFGITAMTGVAANLIGGRTLHNWTGLGLIDKSIGFSIGMLKSKPPSLKTWIETKVLIIDEISMMDISIFEKLHIIGQKVRNNNKEFFGGIQVILCGDFAQLGPISTNNYIFQSKIWHKYISNNIFYLDKVMRQDDPIFIKLLSEIRLGLITDETKEILNNRIITKDLMGEIKANIIEPTKLYPHKAEVEKINNEKLTELLEQKNDFIDYVSTDISFDKKTKINKPCTAEHTQYLDSRIPKKIKLAIGAQVMLVVNLDTDAGLVNGSRGIIKSFFKGFPIIYFDNGIEIRISSTEFKIENNTHIIKRIQIPLILAWAITIHKCQGSTITRVITDMQNIFCDAQGYTTLSRVKSLDGLFLININYNKITCNSEVIEFYNCLSNGEIYDKTIDQLFFEDDDEMFDDCLLD